MLPIMAGSGGGEMSIRAYLEAYRPPKDAPRTLEKRCQVYARFLEYLGELANGPLDSLKPGHCERFFEERAQSMAPRTLRSYRAYLNAAFQAAVKSGLLHESPMRGVPLPAAHTRATEEGRAFTLPEVQRMLTEFPPVYRALVGLRVYCGGLGITTCQNLRRSQLNRKANMLVIKNNDSRGGYIVHFLSREFIRLLDDIAKPEDEYILQELHDIHTCHVSRRFSEICRAHGLIDPAATRRMPAGAKRYQRSFISLLPLEALSTAPTGDRVRLGT